MSAASPSPRILGAVLAAGASTRAGHPKALATFEGEPLVARACGLLREGGADEVVVVIAEPHGRAVAPLVPDARVVVNPDPGRGMLSSLRAALQARGPLDAALFVALVDHPRVRARTARALVQAWRASGAPLVRPRYGGRRGHPYLIDAALFAGLLALPEDASARAFFAASDGCVELEVDDPAVLEDLDTAAELEAAGVLPGAGRGRPPGGAPAAGER